MPQDKFLLIKERTGMSNRILNLLGGILYAQITQRKIIVDWSDEAYSEDGSNVFPKLFSLSNVDCDVKLPETNSVLPKIWQGNLDKSVEDILILCGVNKKENIVRHPLFWSRYRINIARTNYREDVLVRWSYFAEVHKLRRYFQGEFANLQELDDTKILKHLIRHHLILNPDIQHQISSFKNKNFLSPTIGIHIRYTDRKNPFDHYPETIGSLLKSNPNAQIFLATDSLPVQEFFQNLYSNQIILTEKWFPKNTTIVDRLHIHPDCPNRLENAIQALLDMYLLASCDYLICDQNSTFAYVVELLSDMPSENIIDTSRSSFKRKLKQFVYFVERWI